MPSTTTNFGFLLPNVNSADDEDLWGGFLNQNFSQLDTLIKTIMDNILPIGVAVPYRGGTVPSWFLLEDGSAVSRTTYATLFTAIGTTYGAGDGSTTFNLPDSRGALDIGIDVNVGGYADRVTTAGSGVDARTLGARGGSQFMQQHTHVQNAHQHVQVANNDVDFVGPAGTGSSVTGQATNSYVGATQPQILTRAATAVNQNTGTGTSQNMPPVLVAKKMIRAL